MASRRLELISMLEKELDILEKGGYGSPAGVPSRASRVFEDSLACINHWMIPDRRRDVCNGCVLLDFVPPEHRQREHACRFIPLNGRGDTVDSLTQIEDPAQLEAAVRGWLESTIEKLRLQPETVQDSADIDY